MYPFNYSICYWILYCCWLSMKTITVVSDYFRLWLPAKPNHVQFESHMKQFSVLVVQKFIQVRVFGVWSFLRVLRDGNQLQGKFPLFLPLKACKSSFPILGLFSLKLHHCIYITQLMDFFLQPFFIDQWNLIRLQRMVS